MKKQNIRPLFLAVALLSVALGLGADDLDLIADLLPGSGGSYPGNFTAYKGKLYFTARTDAAGFELWVYDGPNPPAMVADIYPGASGSSPKSLKVFQDNLYFSANEGAHGEELWAYDGVNAPHIVSDIYPGMIGSSPYYLEVFDNRLFFAAGDGVHGWELFAYDGVSAPSLVADINPQMPPGGNGAGSNPTGMTVFNGELYFAADDGTNGEELWVYDGVLPPQMVAPGLTPRPYGFTEFNGELYFRFLDSTGRFGLMKYDGINPPVQISFPQDSPAPYCPAVFNGKLYFFATDAISGRELWSYDGVNMPAMVADIYPGVNGAILDSSPSNIMPYAGKIYFQATNGVSGYETWSYDGVGVPELVGDISPGAGNAFPTYFMVFNDRLFFSAEDGAHGREPRSCMPGTLTVTAPNGGELWPMGSRHDITWVSTGTVGDVDIHFSGDNGTTWTLVAGGMANDGLFDWTVPSTPSATCLVRVQESDGSPSDASDAVFASATLPVISGTVTLGGSPLTGVVLNGLPGDPATNSSGVYSSTVSYNWSGTVTPVLAGYVFSPENRTYADIAADQTAQDYAATEASCTITVTSPNGGEEWLPNSSHMITWATSGYLLDVNIELSLDAGVNWNPVAGPLPAGVGSYEWIVPDTPSPECLIRISRADPGPVAADMSDAFFFILPPGIHVTSPNGGEIWTVGSSHDITWTSQGTTGEMEIEYSTDDGASWTLIVSGTENDGLFVWAAVPNVPSTTCLVRVYCPSAEDQSDAQFTIVALETVTSPDEPAGPDSGTSSTSYDFSTGGSTSNLGHPVQYFFDWDDGTTSGWLDGGTTTASHSWSTAGTYDVRAMARCAEHPEVESPWSEAHAIVIAGGSTGYYNSPARHLILPEATWAAASGSGTWVSELQLCDVSGGSMVQAYYNSGTSRLGPFTLWDNGGGGPLSSVRFANILQTLDSLDGSAFVYYGTGGALELLTQDGSHVLQAAVRTYNGDYSRTFPALADVEANTAASGRGLLIANISNNGFYRPSLVLFNPTADSVTVEVRVIGSNGSQVGGTISRSLAGYEQNTIVDELRAIGYANADITVTVTGGAGRVIASGQTAHFSSNDPAAHVAVQGAGGFANSPATRLVLPETTWAAASGGGDWVSEVHISDLSGGSVVTAYYNTGSSRRGPFTLWTNGGGAGGSTTFGNILQTLDNLDLDEFTYYGTGGSLELLTQDGSHLLQASVRTFNGSYSRTFPALMDREETTAAGSRTLLIPNMSFSGFYRPSVVLFNPGADSVTVEVTVIGSNGSQVGAAISRTLAGYEQSTIVNELRVTPYENATVRVRVTGGAGRVIASGQTAHNLSNDPAAHVAVQGQ